MVFTSPTLVPPPLGLGRPSQKSKKYKLVMVQHPIRARCCGFGEKDRRPIDPPPILQLFIEKADGTLQNANEDDSNSSLFVVQCDLMSEDGKEQRSHVYNPSSATSPQSSSESIPTTGTLLTFNEPAPTRSLMGAVVGNAYQLADCKNKPGIFFIFQDLSVRIEGRFRLRFMFTNLSDGDPLTMSTQISDNVLSDAFTVYSAKNFPGMTDSTPISQCFAQQGIKISIRKGRRIRHIVDRTYSNKPVVDTHLRQPLLPTSSSSSSTTTSTNTSKLSTLAPTPTPTSATSETVSSSSSSDGSNKPIHSNSAEESPNESTTTSNDVKPTYRRIDISTILTPESS